MSSAVSIEPVNWCLPIHRSLTPSTDPATVTLAPGFVVLITGSSRGIGLATAISYAKAGASSILLTGRTLETLQNAKQQVVKAAKTAEKVQDVDVQIFVCDVCSEDDTKRIASAVQTKYGKLDALVLNAGKANGLIKGPDGKMDWPHNANSLDLLDFRRTFDVNFMSGVVAIKYLVTLLEAAGPESPKSVIWTTSSSIHRYSPKEMAMGYALSKFTAARFVEYIHEAHQEKGVTAFGIQPGSVMTDMGHQLPEGKDWTKVLIDRVELGGGFCVWLTKERREWLSGRWVDARWDIDELERRKKDIIASDLLKFRLMV